MLHINQHNSIISMLTAAGIRLSHQRMAILQYLLDHHTHPTVADIYDHLHPEYPTLSRTTVYDIDPDSAHYDADLSPHAHFLCRNCHRVFDVPLPTQPLEVPHGFATDSVNISYRGLCPSCAGNILPN